ncbi:MAG: hypothetical protein ACXAC2_23825 [Candidatus Kariarchaeaceae archaeon]|jgi:hypothetical protein
MRAVQIADERKFGETDKGVTFKTNGMRSRLFTIPKSQVKETYKSKIGSKGADGIYTVREATTYVMNDWIFTKLEDDLRCLDNRYLKIS